jgi:anti-anti-sigma factor
MVPNENSATVCLSGDDLVDAATGDARRSNVYLNGEYDLTTVAALSQTMIRALAVDGGDLVVDLSGVQFMDAATIGVLIRVRQKLRFQSRSLTLRAPSTAAKRVLGLCGLTDMLDSGSLDTSPT